LYYVSVELFKSVKTFSL